MFDNALHIMQHLINEAYNICNIHNIKNILLIIDDNTARVLIYMTNASFTVKIYLYDQSPITNQQSPITNRQSLITNHQSSITNHQSPITNH